MDRRRGVPVCPSQISLRTHSHSKEDRVSCQASGHMYSSWTKVIVGAPKYPPKSITIAQIQDLESHHLDLHHSIN